MLLALVQISMSLESEWAPLLVVLKCRCLPLVERLQAVQYLKQATGAIRDFKRSQTQANFVAPTAPILYCSGVISQNFGFRANFIRTNATAPL